MLTQSLPPLRQLIRQGAAILLTLALSALALIGVAPSSYGASGPIAIGDSVMLGAKSQLRAQGFTVDADESRQSYVGPKLLRKRGSTLPKDVVVHLGTNGTFPLETCKALVRRAGAGRHVYLVTIHAKRSWVKGNNATLRACDAAFPPSRVSVVDWNAAASRNPGWLYADGIHLKSEGARNYARLIAEAVRARS